MAWAQARALRAPFDPTLTKFEQPVNSVTVTVISMAARWRRKKAKEDMAAVMAKEGDNTYANPYNSHDDQDDNDIVKGPVPWFLAGKSSSGPGLTLLMNVIEGMGSGRRAQIARSRIRGALLLPGIVLLGLGIYELFVYVGYL